MTRKEGANPRRFVIENRVFHDYPEACNHAFGLLKGMTVAEHVIIKVQEVDWSGDVPWPTICEVRCTLDTKNEMTMREVPVT